jgi:hypothetical protein
VNVFLIEVVTAIAVSGSDLFVEDELAIAA